MFSALKIIEPSSNQRSGCRSTISQPFSELSDSTRALLSGLDILGCETSLRSCNLGKTRLFPDSQGKARQSWPSMNASTSPVSASWCRVHHPSICGNAIAASGATTWPMLASLLSGSPLHPTHIHIHFLHTYDIYSHTT